MHSELSLTVEDRIRDFRELQKAGLICLDGNFMPSVHYPPITMYPPITQEQLFHRYSIPEDEKFVVYAHIPFCKQCCTFCHYPNKYGERIEEKDFYLRMMEKEMDITMRVLGIDRITACSILVGGGTPTYLTLGQLERFLRFFTSKVDLTHCTQFNYDVDPETLLGPEGEARLQLLRAFGVDRLTIGTQSFDNDILRRMNRHHSAEQAIQSVRLSREMGFQTNIEFIFGFPGQSMESWIRDMELAVSVGVEEIQIYRLKVIPYGDKTGVITRHFAESAADFVPVEQALAMKHNAIQILANHGYRENLRRVYTRERKHYSHYAHDQCCNLYDQIGFGLTAFSSLRDRFGLNTQYFGEYYSLVERGRLPVNRGLVRQREDQLRWHMILPLKNRSVIKQRYLKANGVSPGEVFGGKIEKLKEYRLLQEDGDRLELTARGCFFADEVCQLFQHPRYMPFPETAYAKGDLNPYLD